MSRVTKLGRFAYTDVPQSNKRTGSVVLAGTGEGDASGGDFVDMRCRTCRKLNTLRRR